MKHDLTLKLFTYAFAFERSQSPMPTFLEDNLSARIFYFSVSFFPPKTRTQTQFWRVIHPTNGSSPTKRKTKHEIRSFFFEKQKSRVTHTSPLTLTFLVTFFPRIFWNLTRGLTGAISLCCHGAFNPSKTQKRKKYGENMFGLYQARQGQAKIRAKMLLGLNIHRQPSAIIK